MNNETFICECLKCGHNWMPRTPWKPAKCPSCQNRKWQTPPDKPDGRTRKELADLNAMKDIGIRG